MDDDLNSQIVKESKALDVADKEASGIEKALKEYLTASQELSIVGQQLSHEIKRMGEKIPENEWAQATIRLGECQLLLEKLRMEHLEKSLDTLVIEPWRKQRREDDTQLVDVQKKLKSAVRRLDQDSNKRKTQSLNKQASKNALLQLVEEERRVSVIKQDLLRYCRGVGQHRFARWLALHAQVLNANHAHHSAAHQKLAELEPVIQLVNGRHFANFNLPAVFDEKAGLPADGLAPKHDAAHRLSTHFDLALGATPAAAPNKSSTSHRSLAAPMLAPPAAEPKELPQQPSRLSVQVSASAPFAGHSLGGKPGGGVAVLPQPTQMTIQQPLKPVPKVLSVPITSPRSTAIPPPRELPSAPTPPMPTAPLSPVGPNPAAAIALEHTTKERDTLASRQKLAKEAIRTLQTRMTTNSLSTAQISFELDSVLSLLDRGEPLKQPPPAVTTTTTTTATATTTTTAVAPGMSSLDSVEQSIEQILAGLGRASKPAEKPKSSTSTLDQELAALMGKN